jgi:hypothetical protein
MRVSTISFGDSHCCLFFRHCLQMQRSGSISTSFEAQPVMRRSGSISMGGSSLAGVGQGLAPSGASVTDLAEAAMVIPPILGRRSSILSSGMSGAGVSLGGPMPAYRRSGSIVSFEANSTPLGAFPSSSPSSIGEPIGGSGGGVVPSRALPTLAAPPMLRKM